MNANVTKGRTIKTVEVSGITDETDDQIKDFAMSSARETRSSLFGIRLVRNASDTSFAIVTLSID